MLVKDHWEIETTGASRTTILKRNGTPVARFYANRLSSDEMAVMLAKLNRKNGR
jgi:very-short-patch-repair endonuclease